MKKVILKSFIIIVLISCLSVLFYFVCPKFKDVTMSIDDSSLYLEDFVTFNLFKNKSKILNSDELRLGTVGVQKVLLSYNDKKYNVKLNIVDDIKPDVEFKDIDIFLGEEVNQNDFIKNVSDHSDYEIIFNDNDVDYNKIGTYLVLVSVKDKYGNVTEKECKLNIKLFNDIIYHEIGNKFDLKEIYFNNNVVNIENLNIDNLNVNKIGNYFIEFDILNNSYKSEVLVRDNVGPVIKSHDVVYYVNDDVSKITSEDLLEQVFDYSMNFYLISFNNRLLNLGNNKVVINAVDFYGNKSSKIVNILIKNDDVGPFISGAKDLTIYRGSNVNLFENILSIDSSDGVCDITYNKESVDINKVGIYNLVYSSYDKSMNLTKKNVKLTVIPDKEEVDRLFQEFYDKYLKGKDVLGMTKVIREKIKYKNIRGIDPIWTGISTMSGSCYVHAEMLHKALDIAGVENYVVVAKGGYHSWVIAKENDKWRHYDPTPGKHDIGPLTDSEKNYAEGIGNLVWDRDKYPKAN